MTPHLKGKLEMVIENVEKWSKIIFFAIVNVTNVIGIAPRAIVSLYFYYIEDKGPDSFELPLPMW